MCVRMIQSRMHAAGVRAPARPGAAAPRTLWCRRLARTDHAVIEVCVGAVGVCATQHTDAESGVVRHGVQHATGTAVSAPHAAARAALVRPVTPLQA